jgi:peptide/nickel transport system substrate-binding protein
MSRWWSIPLLTGSSPPGSLTAWTFGTDAKSLTFTLRHGVKWSDGTPFTAKDVVFTFQLLKKDFAGGGFPYVASVMANGDYSVTFSFSESFAPALGQIGQQVIVPQHIWSKVSDPTKYTNPNPVGTGPFTQVVTFQSQVYELDRNPHYWQKGKPFFDGIRYPAYAGNDQVDEALVQGDIDWSDVYIPNVATVYAAKSPNYQYWFSPTGYSVPLVLNTTMAPFNDPVVRKAMSMAINRTADVQAVYGNYVSVSNATGIDPHSTWFDSAALSPFDWTKLNVAKANQMLTAAGYKMGPGGVRTTPSGAKMQYTIETGSTSTDFVASAQNIARDLQAIGIDLTVTPKDWNAVISDVSLGHFQLAHMYGDLGPTPYDFYNFTMSCNTVVPVGKETPLNWGRYCDKHATKLLAEFAAATDPATQKTIADELQKAFVTDAPVIPLYTAPDWGEFNSTKFTGFPAASDPYATGQSRYPGAVLILTTVRPKK